MSLSVILLSLFSAALPVIFWFFIFKRKNRKQFFFRFFVTFFISTLGGVAFWQNEDIFLEALKNHDIEIFAAFAILGIGVEYFKNFIVRIAGFRYFKNIDDVMDLSFASALGFTFGENIFYFLSAFSASGQNPITLLKFFLDREFFILPIHLFCSGLFGYFYGMGLFAGDEIKAKNEQRGIFQFLKKVLFFIPEKRIFRSVKILEGTIVSVFFYALFFTLLAKDPTIGDILVFFDFQRWSIDERIMPIISFVFFKFGTIILFSLMDRKRRWDRQNLLIEKK